MPLLRRRGVWRELLRSVARAGRRVERLIYSQSNAVSAAHRIVRKRPKPKHEAYFHVFRLHIFLNFVVNILVGPGSFGAPLSTAIWLVTRAFVM